MHACIIAGSISPGVCGNQVGAVEQWTRRAPFYSAIHGSDDIIDSAALLILGNTGTEIPRHIRSPGNNDRK